MFFIFYSILLTLNDNVNVYLSCTNPPHKLRTIAATIIIQVCIEELKWKMLKPAIDHNF